MADFWVHTYIDMHRKLCNRLSYSLFLLCCLPGPLVKSE